MKERKLCRRASRSLPKRPLHTRTKSTIRIDASFLKRVNAFLRVVHNTLCLSQTLVHTHIQQQFTNNHFIVLTAAAGSFSSSSPPITSFATLTSDSHRLSITPSSFLSYASSTLRSVGDSDVRSVISACSPAAPSGSSPVIIGEWHTFCSHCPAERPPSPAEPTLPAVSPFPAVPTAPDRPATSGELREERERVFCRSGSTVSPTICDTRGDPLRSAWASRSPTLPPSLAGSFTGETPMEGREAFQATPAVSPIPAPGV